MNNDFQCIRSVVYTFLEDLDNDSASGRKHLAVRSGRSVLLSLSLNNRPTEKFVKTISHQVRSDRCLKK